MRMMVKVSIPVVTGNKAYRDGTLQRTVSAALEELRPESAYFYPEGGKRTCQMVIDVKDPSDIPQILEPFFLGLEGEVQLTPVMNAEDLRRGMDKAKSKSGT